MTGWYTERFAREKKMRGLGHYLDELTKPKAEAGPQSWLTTLRALKAQGADIAITRLHPINEGRTAPS